MLLAGGDPRHRKRDSTGYGRPSRRLPTLPRTARQALAYLQPLPCLTAPMAKRPRLAPRTPKPLNGPST